MKGGNSGKSGKNTKNTGKSKATKRDFVSWTAKCGLNLPVPRIAGMLKTNKYAHRIGKGAAVYMTAVLEYIIHEILEIAVEVLKVKKKMRINPSHISAAIKQDEELNEFFSGILISTQNKQTRKKMDEMETQMK